MDWVVSTDGAGCGFGKAIVCGASRTGVEDRAGKLEIESPTAKSNLPTLCLAASSDIKWRAYGATFAFSRGYPLGTGVLSRDARGDPAIFER
jgi:hypothetical protein